MKIPAQGGAVVRRLLDGRRLTPSPAPDLRYIAGMTTLFFFQIVGAVFLGCVLFAFSAYMIWAVHKRERSGGCAQDVSGWAYTAGLIGPAIAVVALYLLK